MKNFKKGFTLAEVLISLTVIGIIAAITLPTTLSNYQAKVVGVKLSKFAGHLEGSALAYVSDYGSFVSAEDASSFLNKTFIVKNTVSTNSNSPSLSGANLSAQKNEGKLQQTEAKQQVINITKGEIKSMPSSISILKDGTGITTLSQEHLNFKDYAAVVDRYKVGDPKFVVKFYPNVKGLPSFAQQNFNFVVTELGYVYPHNDDTCLWSIYNNDYRTNADTYSLGSACVTNDSLSGSNEKVDFINLEKIINDNIERSMNTFN